MPGGLEVISQSDFSAGMFQAPDTQKIPANGAYDIVNGLLDQDAGVVYRRGGGTYLVSGGGGSSNGGRIWSLMLAAGQRTMWAGVGQSISGLQVLADDDQTATTMLSGIALDGEPGTGHGMAWFPANAGTAPTIYAYAGYRGSAGAYTTGTIAATQGSAVVTGTGTSFTGNVLPGFMLSLLGTTAVAVKSVDSNTQVTLTAPWTGATVTGATYTASSTVTIPITNFAGRSGPLYATAAGNRLVLGCGDQVIFVSLDDVPSLFYSITTNLHQLPNGAQVRGLAAVRDTVLVFTDRGIHTISNLSLDLTDANGNPQQRLELLSSEVVLRGHHGISSWKNAMIVPATDDVYLIDGVSSPVPVSQPIRSLYRTLTQTAALSLGQAQVFKGHYVLPVTFQQSSTGHSPSRLNLTSQTTLVCNLDSGTWTEVVPADNTFSSGDSVGFSRRTTVVPTGTNAGTVTTQLLGISNRCLFDCTGWWAPTAANKSEPNDIAHVFSITTRDYSTSNIRALFKKARIWLEGVDAGSDSPTVSLAAAVGPPGTAFSPLTLTRDTGGASSGDTPAGAWAVNTGGRRVRFQISSTSPWASLKIKALDIFVRPKGRA